MKIDRQSFFDNLPTFAIFIIFLIILSTAININISSSPQDFWKANIGEILVGLGTILLAFFTSLLTTATEREGKKQRKMIIEEAQTERQRLRLKEQLEGLYSPLIGLGTNFEKPEFHSVYYKHPVRTTMGNIRSVYSYLASNALKDLLDLYYNNYYSPNHMPDSNMLKNLHILFTSDFEEITKKYQNITISKEEEIRKQVMVQEASKLPLPK
jgi:hypothetical protein